MTMLSLSKPVKAVTLCLTVLLALSFCSEPLLADKGGSRKGFSRSRGSSGSSGRSRSFGSGRSSSSKSFSPRGFSSGRSSSRGFSSGRSTRSSGSSGSFGRSSGKGSTSRSFSPNRSSGSSSFGKSFGSKSSKGSSFGSSRRSSGLNKSFGSQGSSSQIKSRARSNNSTFKPNFSTRQNNSGNLHKSFKKSNSSNSFENRSLKNSKGNSIAKPNRNRSIDSILNSVPGGSKSQSGSNKSKSFSRKFSSDSNKFGKTLGQKNSGFKSGTRKNSNKSFGSENKRNSGWDKSFDKQKNIINRRQQSLQQNRLFDNNAKKFQSEFNKSKGKSLSKYRTFDNQKSFRKNNRRNKPTIKREALLGKDFDSKQLKGKQIPKLKFNEQGRKQFAREFNNRRRIDNTGVKNFKEGNFGKRKQFNKWNRDKVDRFASHKWAKDLNLKKQYEFRKHGDIGRRMHLGKHLHDHGGWHKRRHAGLVHRHFHRHHFSSWYAGAWFFPRYCWTPRWSPWVSWSWWDHCYPIYDHRPIVCRPLVCDPCPTWTYYETPVWTPLSSVPSGTWVDPPVVAALPEMDLQILAVRFVDPGHVEQNLGPRYRIWFRNNSQTDTNHGFNIVALATNAEQLGPDAPQAGVRVDNMVAEEINSVDIRLPMKVNQMNLDEQNRKTPFAYLHVLVDSDQELSDIERTNNGITLNVREILPVDPAAFAAEIDEVSPGELLSVAGEGFGPEPGEVTVIIDGKEWPTEIYGWYDLGVRFQVPEVTVAGAKKMEIVIVRGDGATSNPIEVELSPPEPVLAIPPIPE